MWRDCGSGYRDSEYWSEDWYIGGSADLVANNAFNMLIRKLIYEE
jgi:hypothetical protein